MHNRGYAGHATMLFLLNEQIVDIAIPESHLAKRWKVLGCGDPYAMRARDALDFAGRVVTEHIKEGIGLEPSLVEDLGALIIAKTGANAVLFPNYGGAVGEPRLTILPETILSALKERDAESVAPQLEQIWASAA